jgi:hypothetical protein
MKQRKPAEQDEFSDSESPFESELECESEISAKKTDDSKEQIKPGLALYQ